MEREAEGIEPLRLATSPSRSAAVPALTAGEAVVWRLYAPSHRPLPALAFSLLDAAERDRAGRLQDESARRLFIIAHAMLRRVLSAVAGMAPQDVRYVRTPQGKPFWPGGPEFSLSHAGDCVVVAVCPDSPLGVDVEPRRRLPDADAIVRQFFAPEEQHAYRQHAPADRELAFLTAWTRKEAYVKALGDGLSVPPSAFAVSLDDPPRLLRPWAKAAGPAPRLWNLPLGPGRIGALAGHVHRLTCRDFRL